MCIATLILRAISILVPASRRETWLAEWHAEFEHAWKRAPTRDGASLAFEMRLLLRAASSVADAMWLRRRHRSATTWSWAVFDAARALKRQPGFALTVAGTLALGIGSATAVFSILDGLVLRPPPFHEPERLVSITGARGGRVVDLEVLSLWDRRTDVFEGVRGHAGWSVVFTGAGDARSYRVEAIEPGLLDLLGVRPVLGRPFVEEHATPGNHGVVLLSARVWREAFGAGSDVLGRTVRLDGETFTVIGVLPSSIRRLPGGSVDLVVPLTKPHPWGNSSAMALARLRDGVSMEQATARLGGLAEILNREAPREQGWALGLAPLRQSLSDTHETAFRVLGGAALCILLIACANAAGLLILRGVSQLPALGVRVALGASRTSLVRLVLAQGGILAIGGGIVGTLLAWGGVRALAGLLPAVLLEVSYTEVGLDRRVLAFALGLTALTGLVFSVPPALRAGAAGAARSRGETTSNKPEVRLRATMQIGQLALAVILLSGAGLLARSFVALATVPTGFDVDRLLRLELVSMERLHGGPETSSALAHQLEERLRVLPGVVGVARSGGTALRFGAVVEPQGGTTRRVEVLASIGVDTAFFGTMGISVAEGRAFRSDDHQDYSSASILDRDLAQVLWPDENPVGRTFRIDDEGWRTVVGLSDDARMEGPTDPFGPFRLFGLRDPEERPGPFVWIRTEGDPAAQVEVVRSVVRAVDPDQPIASLETGREILGETVANPRLLLTAVATFAVLALLLASVGAYGLVAFMVAEARREIGIRLVLGAEPPRLLAEMLGRGLLLGGAGVALGLACSAAVAHVARAVLFGVSPLDPVALGLAPSVLLIACALALIGPARRASRVDPTVVLGAE